MPFWPLRPSELRHWLVLLGSRIQYFSSVNRTSDSRESEKSQKLNALPEDTSSRGWHTHKQELVILVISHKDLQKGSCGKLLRVHTVALWHWLMSVPGFEPIIRAFGATNIHSSILQFKAQKERERTNRGRLDAHALRCGLSLSRRTSWSTKSVNSCVSEACQNPGLLF